MSVYTHLSDDEFFAFCGLYGITFKKAIPIVQGVKQIKMQVMIFLMYLHYMKNVCLMTLSKWQQ